MLRTVYDNAANIFLVYVNKHNSQYESKQQKSKDKTVYNTYKLGKDMTELKSSIGTFQNISMQFTTNKMCGFAATWLTIKRG